MLVSLCAVCAAKDGAEALPPQYSEVIMTKVQQVSMPTPTAEAQRTPAQSRGYSSATPPSPTEEASDCCCHVQDEGQDNLENSRVSIYQDQVRQIPRFEPFEHPLNMCHTQDQGMPKRVPGLVCV